MNKKEFYKNVGGILVVLPNVIKDKIKRYIIHSLKSQILRNEINEWLDKKGIDTEYDNYTQENDAMGSTIDDILIDAGQHGDYEKTVDLLEKEIKDWIK
jgi:hypothetical protein